MLRHQSRAPSVGLQTYTMFLNKTSSLHCCNESSASDFHAFAAPLGREGVPLGGGRFWKWLSTMQKVMLPSLLNHSFFLLGKQRCCSQLLPGASTHSEQECKAVAVLCLPWSSSKSLLWHMVMLWLHSTAWADQVRGKGAGKWQGIGAAEEPLGSLSLWWLCRSLAGWKAAPLAAISSKVPDQ